MNNLEQIKDLLDQKVVQFNHPDFIGPDPVCIPRSFSSKEDIEISGFFAAILAWGQRKTIINKCKELMERMDNAPYQFIMDYQDQDLKALEGFKHRTFNDTDLLYFTEALRYLYTEHQGLEGAFIKKHQSSETDTGKALSGFRDLFFSLEDYPRRTQKHISSPLKNATCKRLNMYLRWMVRKDNKGVDFGLWTDIKMNQLVCPCDVHVERVARLLGMLDGTTKGWKMAIELTDTLKLFDPHDPVKYDYALFGLGVEGYF